MYIDIFACHDRVAVVVDSPWLTTCDMQALGTEGLDLRVVRQRLHKEVGSHLWGIERVEGLHDDHVQLAVLHGGARCDIGIVAVLRGVGTGNENPSFSTFSR